MMVKEIKMEVKGLTYIEESLLKRELYRFNVESVNVVDIQFKKNKLAGKNEIVIVIECLNDNFEDAEKEILSFIENGLNSIVLTEETIYQGGKMVKEISKVYRNSQEFMQQAPAMVLEENL